MTHNNPSTQHSKRLLGDELWHMAMGFADQVNASEHATACRQRTISNKSYFDYVTAMYPIVTGFNGCLIRCMAKIDHVRNHRTIHRLAEQLQEEQAHNSMWRRMMDVYGIDHDSLNLDFESYLGRYSWEELYQMSDQVRERVRVDLHDVNPGVFPDPVVPETVIALYALLHRTATDPSISYWVHFACQSVIEFMIFEVVSESVYPGIKDHPELDLGPATTTWWAEHARQGSADGKKTDEEKHLEIAKITMNRMAFEPALADQVLEHAGDAMRLFAGTSICHNPSNARFCGERYFSNGQPAAAGV